MASLQTLNPSQIHVNLEVHIPVRAARGHEEVSMVHSSLHMPTRRLSVSLIYLDLAQYSADYGWIPTTLIYLRTKQHASMHSIYLLGPYGSGMDLTLVMRAHVLSSQRTATMAYSAAVVPAYSWFKINWFERYLRLKDGYGVAWV